MSDIKLLSVLNKKMIDSNKIELKKKQIAEYYMLNKKTVKKIDKMCTNYVQMKFFSIKND
jgi:predicted regulator of amino acid metabolism with ACT domain